MRILPLAIKQSACAASAALQAAAYLLEKVSWTGISSDFRVSLTASRTQQLCNAVAVSKDLMANLLLAAGGRGGISTGGGGSNSELTN